MAERSKPQEEERDQTPRGPADGEPDDPPGERADGPETSDERADEASKESFPTSDPPAW